MALRTDEDLDDFGSDAERVGWAQQTCALLRSLPSVQREIVELVYFQRQSFEAVAARLRLPLTTINAGAVRALQTVADALGNAPINEYRFLFDEVTAAGHEVSERTVVEDLLGDEWWCVFGTKRRVTRPARSAGHEALVRREFSAQLPNGCGCPTSPKPLRLKLGLHLRD